LCFIVYGNRFKIRKILAFIHREEMTACSAAAPLP
jgi:hypothetical protein